MIRSASEKKAEASKTLRSFKHSHPPLPAVDLDAIKTIYENLNKDTLLESLCRTTINSCGKIGPNN